MPYTPPSQRSPGNSSSNSPDLSRNHSYENAGVPAGHPQRAAALPRSRSATYLQKHRRTPSLSDHQPAYDGPPSLRQIQHQHGVEENGHAAANGVTHSPRPELPLTADGSTVSPSESPGGSEDDED